MSSREYHYLVIVNGLIKYNNLYFTTCTIHKWQNLLEPDQNKDIILEALSYLSHNKRIVVYAFVILENHIHLIIEVIPPDIISKIIHSKLSYSSKKLKKSLTQEELQSFAVAKSNKTYQFWKPKSLSVELYTKKFFVQKFNYVHKNVERAGLDPEKYKYSSYPSYLFGEPKFDFLTLWG